MRERRSLSERNTTAIEFAAAAITLFVITLVLVMVFLYQPV